LEFDAAAFEDLAWWIETDRKTALRIVRYSCLPLSLLINMLKYLLQPMES